MTENNWWRIYESGQRAFHKGQDQKAAEIFEGLLTKPIPPELRAAMLNDLGVVRHRSGLLEGAIQAYEEALLIENNLGDSKKLANLLINLGGAYYQIRRFKEAVRAYEGGIGLLDDKSQSQLFLAGLSWRNLGRAYLGLHQESQAVYALQRSLEILEKSGERREVGITLHRLAEAYLAKYKWPEAVGAYRQAAAIWEALRDRHSLAAAYLGRGEVYLDWEKYEEALAQLETAQQIYKKENDADGEAKALVAAGRVCTAINAWEKGEAFYKKALKIREKLKDERGRAMTLWPWATLHFEKGDRAKAIAHMEEAVKVLERLQDPDSSRARHYLDIFRHKRSGRVGRYF